MGRKDFVPLTSQAVEKVDIDPSDNHQPAQNSPKSAILEANRGFELGMGKSFSTA
jgi:hypothetical protein